MEYDGIIILKVIECPKCHIAFGIPNVFHEKRKKDHQLFYCPLGHVIYFDQKSQEEKLKERIDYLCSRLHQMEKENLHWQRRALGYKGYASKLKKN